MINSSLKQLGDILQAKKISSVELTQSFLDRIHQYNPTINAYIALDEPKTLAQAKAADSRIAAGNVAPLTGIPIAQKDIFCAMGWQTTCGSKMLANFIAPYDAHVISLFDAAGAVNLGKTNMDEFAMGSSTENSAYGPTHNPWDLTRIPGGSGGGSAAALAAFEAPLAIGTDTGGSIRQPAAVTGTVGVKPTYGGVSRYGLVAFSSSLDQAGPCARTVLDAALLHEAIAGHDPKDSTSINAPIPAVVAAAKSGNVKGMKIGVVKELNGDGYQKGVRTRFEESLELLAAAGAEIVEVSAPNFEYALAAYYLIAPSECSSNLARFDAMRYGLRVGDNDGASAESVMNLTREVGFGREVKRRIILGTYALSSGYYDAYYGSAQKVRTLITQDLNKAFEKADVLVSPTCPTTAFKIGEKANDPLAMYLNDIATIPVNMAGIGGMSLPSGVADEDGLPVGFQIMSPVMKDDRMYSVGAALEAALLSKWGAPLLSTIPALVGSK